MLAIPGTKGLVSLSGRMQAQPFEKCLEFFIRHWLLFIVIHATSMLDAKQRVNKKRHLVLDAKQASIYTG